MAAWRVRFGVLGACIAAGCGTPMMRTRLDSLPPTGQTVTARATEIDLSVDVSRVQMSDDSRIAVTLVLINASDVPRVVDLSRARLYLREQSAWADAAKPVAAGAQESPTYLQDGTFIGPIRIPPGAATTVWVAFGNIPNAASIEVPPYATLELFEEGTEESLRVALYDPSIAMPRWYGTPPKTASYYGLAGAAGLDEGSVQFLRETWRYDVDPFVLAWGFGLGFRVPQHPSSTGQKIACCDLGLHAELALPMLQGRAGWLGPFAGVEMVHFATRDERVDKPFWIGPELGLFVTLWRLRRSYGPFPVRTGPSRLGQVTMEAAYVRWFGADWPTGGESGFLLSMQWAVSVPAF